MRLPFGWGRRRREIDEVRARIAQLREEIAKLELGFEESAPEEQGTDAYRSVQRLRATVLLQDLIAKRTELANLEDREAALEAASGERAPAATTPPKPSPPAPEPAAVSPEPAPAVGFPAARAIIEPPRDEAPAEVETAAQAPAPVVAPEPVPEEEPAAEPIATGGVAPTMSEVETLAPAAAEEPAGPEVQAVEPEPTATAEEAVMPADQGEAVAAPSEPTAETATAAGEVPEEAGASTEEAGAAVAPGQRGPARAPVVVAAIVVLAGLGLMGAFSTGIIKLGGGEQPTPQATSPVVVLPPTPVPTAAASPTATTAPPATATVSAAPTPTPETAIFPETEPGPEGPSENVAIFAPPGFSGAYLRSEPSMSATILRFLPNGTRVDVFEDSVLNGGFFWSRARAADGLTGWVVATTVGR